MPFSLTSLIQGLQQDVSNVSQSVGGIINTGEQALGTLANGVIQSLNPVSAQYPLGNAIDTVKANYDTVLPYLLASGTATARSSTTANTSPFVNLPTSPLSPGLTLVPVPPDQIPIVPNSPVRPGSISTAQLLTLPPGEQSIIRDAAAAGYPLTLAQANKAFDAAAGQYGGVFDASNYMNITALKQFEGIADSSTTNAGQSSQSNITPAINTPISPQHSTSYDLAALLAAGLGGAGFATAATHILSRSHKITRRSGHARRKRRHAHHIRRRG